MIAARDVIVRHAPDILVLSDIDYDAELRALRAFAELLAEETAPYPHLFARRPNSGMPSGLDMDGDGLEGGPRDAQGFGYFSGQGGLAVLSRHPFDEAGFQDFSTLLWTDAPDALLPRHDNGAPFPSESALSAQRLSSVAHWVLPVITPGGPITLLTHQAGPPVFDGPEDRNGKRNRDENALWLHLLAGRLGPPLEGPFAFIGGTNLDPADGDGYREVMRALLEHPKLQDPRPRSEGGAAVPTPGQSGDPGLDTADWREPSPGNMRVDYVLPSTDFTVKDAGVYWPPAGRSGHDLALAASRHRLVWVDVELP